MALREVEDIRDERREVRRAKRREELSLLVVLTGRP
jgi:hypothetical protein